MGIERAYTTSITWETDVLKGKATLHMVTIYAYKEKASKEAVRSQKEVNWAHGEASRIKGDAESLKS